MRMFLFHSFNHVKATLDFISWRFITNSLFIFAEKSDTVAELFCSDVTKGKVQPRPSKLSQISEESKQQPIFKSIQSLSRSL